MSESDKRDTLAAIVAEIRAYGAQPPPRLMWLEIADRIEAIDKADALRCLHTPGNAAAMREAFKGLDEEMKFCERNVELGIGFALEGLREHCRIVRQILNAALSAPDRQCDMGTAEEQMKRFDEFTSKYWPLGMFALQWAQTPYEAEEGGAK